MKRRLQGILAGVVLCALLAAVLPAPAAAADFQDVPDSHWAAEPIGRAADLGLIQGQTADRFGLGSPMTRGAFVTVLCRLFGWEMISPETGSYTDNQDPSAWYFSAVETAYAHGAITDQTDEFRPRDPITREEMAVMLVRAMGYGTIAGLAQDLPMPFQDVTTNAGYIAMAYELGLVNGTSAAAFSPDRTATREQAAAMLMRLYDGYHTAAPERIGIARSAEGLTDLTGYAAVAVPGGRLIGAGGARVTNQPAAEITDAILSAVRAAGTQPLLYVIGGGTALRGDTDDLASALVSAVDASGCEGLFLDLEKLSSEHKRDFTALAEALRERLGDRPLYLMAEAPVWQGETHGGYDCAALAEFADRLVLRVTPYEEASAADFPVGPVEPLEEVYYALEELRETAEQGKISLLLTTTGAAWSDERHTGDISAAEIEALLADPQTRSYYADRYGCAYLTTDDGAAVWYLDGEAARERVRLAAFFGVDQVCLSDLTSVADYDNYSLLSGLE